MKPEDISQEAWDAAARCVPPYVSSKIIADIARALMAAEKRGEEREREACIAACAKEADDAKGNGLPHVAMGANWCNAAIRNRSKQS